MQRLNINELINVNNNYVKDGTAAMYLATNPHNNKEGILKQNGCICGIENEDLREKLANVILNLCGVDSAIIELCQDKDKNNYCFSYNVLQKNQKHIQLQGKALKEQDKEKLFLEYMQNTFTSIMCLPQITFKEYEEIKKRIIEIHFMDLIIDHYDRKTDNHKIIYDESTKQYLPPVCYDYGTAFNPDSQQKNGIFFYLSNEEVMCFLLKYHYKDLSQLISNIDQKLTEENLNLILNQDLFKDLNPKLIYKQIETRIKQMKKILNIEKDNEQSFIRR